MCGFTGSGVLATQGVQKMPNKRSPNALMLPHAIFCPEIWRRLFHAYTIGSLVQLHRTPLTLRIDLLPHNIQRQLH